MHEQSVLNNSGKMRHVCVVSVEVDATAGRVTENLHFHYMRSATARVHRPAATPTQECLAPRADSVDSDIEGVSLDFGKVGWHSIDQGNLQPAAFQGAGQAQAHEPAADNRNIERRQGKNSC
jgi:hypothetical protein